MSDKRAQTEAQEGALQQKEYNSWLDFLEAIRTGRRPPSPAAELVGYRLVEIAPGRALFELVPHQRHCNFFTSIHGGILATLLDSAMTAVVLATLPAGQGCTTAEIKVNYVRPVTLDCGVLRCEARTIHIGQGLATAEGRVQDLEGRLYAHGVCTCAVRQAQPPVEAASTPPP